MRTGGWETRTGSASTRSATRRRGSRPSPTCGCTPSSSTTRRSGSRSPRTSSAAWAATADGARACAVEIVRRWEIHANFDLYDDAIPVLEALRAHGLRIGLISNGQRDLEAFARHHELDVDVAVGSKSHGRTKPHASIFETALASLGVAAAETVMVGDSYADDIEGARALGMRAILLDREGLYPGEPDRIADLGALPAALGLAVRS